MSCPSGTRFQVLAPVVRGRKGEYGALFQQLSTEGYARVRVDGEVHPIDEVPRLEKHKKHSIEVVVDRLVQKEDMRRRLADSIETALQLADGLAMIEVVPTRESIEHAADAGLPEPQAETLVFSEHLACAHCGLSFEQLAPRNFSFNSPYGACETCSGLGTQLTVDPELVIGDPDLSVEDGVVLPWGTGAQSNYYQQLLRATVRHAGGRPGDPVARAVRRGAATPSCTASTAGSRCPTPTATAGGARTRRRSRASSPRCCVVTPRPSPTTSASRSSSTCARCPAPPAAASASSRSCWP